MNDIAQRLQDIALNLRFIIGEARDPADLSLRDKITERNNPLIREQARALEEVSQSLRVDEQPTM